MFKSLGSEEPSTMNPSSMLLQFIASQNLTTRVFEYGYWWVMMNTLLTCEYSRWIKATHLVPHQSCTLTFLPAHDPRLTGRLLSGAENHPLNCEAYIEYIDVKSNQCASQK